ncbi:MAG TPA: GAF domain-containing protein [Oculatellaceae cyanobacterium]|jgi:GAF domain-containing protein
MSDLGLKKILDRLSDTLARDTLVQKTTDELRELLQVDRVVLYYFYRPWSGRVTFESLSNSKFSILGSTGPDECFNSEYAALYEAGRWRAIADIEVEPLQPCHRDLLRTMKIRANLVVPIINQRRLWGLLIAHNCQFPRPWLASDIKAMQTGAYNLAIAPSIKNS